MGKSGGAGTGAVIGGVVGSVVPVIGTVAGAAVGGVIGSAFDQAGAINDSAQAQLNQEMRDRSQALGFAAPSDMELQQLQESITLNRQDIARKQKLLASSDPALIEAGHQALALLQGKQASSIAPIQNQRAQQRSQLQQTLSQQLGTDYSTSSAGIQALNNFDQQTANLTTNAQQSTLQQLLGVAQNTENFGSVQPNFENEKRIMLASNDIANRQVEALSRTTINQSAGYAGQIMQNAAVGNAFGTFASLGTMSAATRASGNYGGSTAPAG